MTEIQILCLFILFAIANIRPLMFRHCSVHSDPVSTTSMCSIWFFAGVILLYPFYGHMLHEAMPVIKEHPYLILIGFSKGAVLWLVGYVGQYLRTQSNSSCAYAKQISIAGIAVVNSLQGEILALPQWLAVLALFLLGIVFVFKGHISELSRKYKLCFFAMILLCIVPASSDYAVISHTNWYVMLTCVSISMITITCFKLRSFKKVRKLFSSGPDVALGAVILTTEVGIMMILVTHIPVTMAVLTMSLSLPTMMVVSSVFWKEGNWKQQLAFGCMGYVAMLPMILI